MPPSILPPQSEDYPLANTEATKLLAAALARAQAQRGVTQRDVARELNYKSSVVLSHMALGRVPIPVDRAPDIARLLGLDSASFIRAVLEQRHPDIDFAAVLGSPAREEPVSHLATELEAIAGRPLDELGDQTKQILREVVAAADPARRWVSLTQLAIVDAVRSSPLGSSANAATIAQLTRLRACLAADAEADRSSS